MLIQGKPPLVLSGVPQGVEVELFPAEEGPCGLPMWVRPVGRWDRAGDGAAVAMLSPGPSHLALQALQVAGCTHPPHTMPRQAGLQPQAQEFPGQPLSHRVPGEWKRAWEQWMLLPARGFQGTAQAVLMLQLGWVLPPSLPTARSWPGTLSAGEGGVCLLTGAWATESALQGWVPTSDADLLHDLRQVT